MEVFTSPSQSSKESSTPGDPYSFMLPDQFCNLTCRELMSWRLEDSNQSISSSTSNGYQGGTKQDSRYESNQSAYQLLAFKKRIEREVSQYTVLKHEKYFVAFKGTFQSQPQPMTVKRSWMEMLNNFSSLFILISSL